MALKLGFVTLDRLVGGFYFADASLVENHLTKAWKISALHLDIRRPQPRTHQRFRTMQINFADGNLNDSTRWFTKLDHRCEQICIVAE